MSGPGTGDALHLALAIDESYVPWAAVAALSCVERTPERALHVHLLHDGELTGSRPAADLRALLERAGAAVTLHAVHDDRLDRLPALDRFGAVVWLRFLLPDLLPDVARVLYLDADTLAADSVAPLLDVDLHGLPVGAVANVVAREHWGHLGALGLQDRRHVLNSGVLLLDLDRMRALDTTDELLEVAAGRSGQLLWPDQDALNVTLQGRWHPLPARWNAQNSFWAWRPLALDVLGAPALDDAVRHPGIVHFEGPGVCKPWHELCDHPWRDAWWATLGRTPWADLAPQDRTVTTRLLGRLPRAPRLALYVRLLAARRRWARGRARLAELAGAHP